jgi:hypothetical protein
MSSSQKNDGLSPNQIKQISKLCASELAFFTEEMSKLTNVKSKINFMKERLLITLEQSNKIIGSLKKKQLPRRETIKKLMNSSLMLIDMAERQKELPLDQPKLVD